ncbi:MAG: prepilin-type N-terminal cleavage/methylation domain-containing protein [Planctomycetes bacterium]|nr:prepilin-type N-terminal cleavage/methylation domain-containing protein [Planctomycetota bacterium]
MRPAIERPKVPLSALAKAKRFTLVEMLIGVAIIAILAALLCPSLKNAIERGRTLACLNNERQIGICVVSYAQDNHDRLPNKPFWGPGNYRNNNKCESYSNTWPVHVLPYAGKKATRLSDMKDTIFQCPNLGKTGILYKDGHVGGYNGWILNSYGHNQKINGTQLKREDYPKLKAWDLNGNLTADAAKNGYFQFARLGKVKDSAKVVFTADGGTRGEVNELSDNQTSWNTQYYSDKFSFRHNKYDTINVLYVDGHAAPMHFMVWCYDYKNPSEKRVLKFSGYWAVHESFNK